MLKLTGGEFRGRNIECPPGNDIRPTSSKARQGIFNTLFSMGFQVQNSRILELFAGTGLMSFEAISRGACSAVLVDQAKSSLDVISRNVSNLKLDGIIKLVRDDSIVFVDRHELDPFDLVYLDPPYKYRDYGKLLSKILSKVTSSTIVIAESNKEIMHDVNVPFELLKVKDWGKSKAFFIKKNDK